MSKFCVFAFFLVSSVLLLAQATRSKPKSSSPKNEKNPYVLAGFDTKKVAQLKDGKTEWDRCWDKRSYQVCVTRYSGGDEYLTWTNKKNKMTVQMKKYKNGSISQTWLLDGFGISLFKSYKGRISQDWDFPHTKWTYNKSPEGEVDQEWDGEEDPKEVEKYKSVIDSWCAVNGFYMGEENCKIY